MVLVVMALEFVDKLLYLAPMLRLRPVKDEHFHNMLSLAY